MHLASDDITWAKRGDGFFITVSQTWEFTWVNGIRAEGERHDPDKSRRVRTFFPISTFPVRTEGIYFLCPFGLSPQTSKGAGIRQVHTLQPCLSVVRQTDELKHPSPNVQIC